MYHNCIIVVYNQAGGKFPPTRNDIAVSHLTTSSFDDGQSPNTNFRASTNLYLARCLHKKPLEKF